MPFVGQCTSCNKKMKFPDHAVGSSFECPKCRNAFTVAPVDAAFLDTPTPRLQDEWDEPESASAPQAFAGAQSATKTPLHPLAAGAIISASLALISASIGWLNWLTIPASILALLCVVAAVLAEPKPNTVHRVICVGGGAIALGVLVVAFFWPHWFGISWMLQDAEPVDPTQQYVMGGDGVHKQTAESWVNAQKSGIKIDDAFLDMAGVTPRVLVVKDGSTKKIQKTALLVHLRLTNLGINKIGADKPIPYASWNGAGPNAPSLKDEQGRQYPFFVVKGVTGLQGKTGPNGLEPGEHTEIVLAFERTAARAETLYLRLPGSGNRPFQFRFPFAWMNQ